MTKCNAVMSADSATRIDSIFLHILSIASLVCALVIVGAAVPKCKTCAIVPPECMHQITITDFGKPCRQDSKNPNVAHCDDVTIRFACVKYPLPK